MAGGIDAWNGLVAEGTYEEGLAYFSRASGADELISLSLSLEEGNRAFYERIAREARDSEAAEVFRSLVLAEERHKETLLDLYARVARKDTTPQPPEEMEAGRFLEGGISVDEATERTRDRPLGEILELAVAMEANSLDRYIKMGRAVDDDMSRKVFLLLSGEERSHLERLASVLDGIKSRG